MSNKSEASTPNTAAAEPAPAPTAKDVAEAISKVVGVLSHLPPQLQLRALGGAATALGVDKESRSRTTTSTQQRSNQGQQQNRSGSNR